MEQKELTVQEIHKNTLKILEKIIEICEENDIGYFLAYGSLIGAIRHKGFIPWDDDLDIMMLRPEYDKFLKYCYEHGKELYPFKLLTRDSCENYPYNIARFNDMNYRVVYNNIRLYDSGLFIDIYPLDGAGNGSKDEIKKKYQKRKSLLFSFAGLSIDDHYEPSEKNKWWRSGIKYLGRLYAKIRGADYWLDKLLEFGQIFPFEESKYIANMVWSPFFDIFEKSDFAEYMYAEFEGISVRIPKKYDKILKNIYGDYMQLPPEEKRVMTHQYKIYRR